MRSLHAETEADRNGASGPRRAPVGAKQAEPAGPMVHGAPIIALG